ncbi:hypothetical protein NESM_000274900 [Novymonas esmeraldas]|uniref:Uncharacterized protein n=1 Tax=Novymonas esmeraldas TaxID=1808958 RepID=A0AAW0FEI2_9TRYP
MSHPTPTAAPPAASFQAFVLERVAHSPALISETAYSLASSTTASSTTTTTTATQHSGAEAADVTTAAPRTTDAAQRAVIALAGATGSVATSNPASALAVTAVLQRAIVDAPLLPFGGSHLLHELVWSPFVVCAEAARQLGRDRAALRIAEGRLAAPGPDAGARAGGESAPAIHAPREAAEEARHADGVLKEVAEEDLAACLPHAALLARVEQAQQRLCECRRDLRRGWVRLRRILADLQAYDAVPLATLTRQQQEDTRALFTSVVVGDVVSATTTTRSTAADVVAAVPVADGGHGALDRKRLREV